MPTSTLPRFLIVQAKIQCISALGLGTCLLSRIFWSYLRFMPALAGLALLTVPEVVHKNPIADRLTSFLHPAGVAHISGPLVNQVSTLSGVFFAAIGISYFTNFYHGYEEWLYLSIPGRLFVSGLCLAIWFFAPEKMSSLLFVIMVWDGISAAIGGYLIGNWSGQKPAKPDTSKIE